MEQILNFEDIVDSYQTYNVQGKITSDISLFYTKKQLPILSFIIQDNFKSRIQCLAFGEESIQFKNMLNVDKTYTFNKVIAVNNKTYCKTNHLFKLKLTTETKIIELKMKQYKQSDKICVEMIQNNKKQLNLKRNKSKHQLSIKNWFK